MQEDLTLEKLTFESEIGRLKERAQSPVLPRTALYRDSSGSFPSSGMRPAMWSAMPATASLKGQAARPHGPDGDSRREAVLPPADRGHQDLVVHAHHFGEAGPRPEGVLQVV